MYQVEYIRSKNMASKVMAVTVVTVIKNAKLILIKNKIRRCLLAESFHQILEALVPDIDAEYVNVEIHKSQDSGNEGVIEATLKETLCDILDFDTNLKFIKFIAICKNTENKDDVDFTTLPEGEIVQIRRTVASALMDRGQHLATKKKNVRTGKRNLRDISFNFAQRIFFVHFYIISTFYTFIFRFFFLYI